MVDGCEHCDHGWVQVKPAYAEHLAKSWGEPGTEGFRLAYAGLIDSHYPCRYCLPTQFYRWAKGHWLANHEMGSCVECIELRHGKTAAAAVKKRKEGDAVTQQAARDMGSEDW